MAPPIYDSYAAVYDAIGQGRFGAQLAGWALGWLRERGLVVRHALDLACGTGDGAFVLAAEGCSVTAIDRSDAMLRIAGVKARDLGYNIDFIQGDIGALDQMILDDGCPGSGLQSLNRRSPFDLATCFYDSLNYLIGDGALRAVFGAVERMLRPGGYLVFDMNMPAEYATWDGRSVVTYDSGDCLVYNQLRFDARSRLATGRIVWFVRGIDRWERGEETHAARAWRDVEIDRALSNTGFSLVARLSPRGEPVGADAPRVVYLAQKAEG